MIFYGYWRKLKEIKIKIKMARKPRKKTIKTIDDSRTDAWEDFFNLDDKISGEYKEPIDKYDELLKSIELQGRFKHVIGRGYDFKNDTLYKTVAEEADMDLILTLNKLGIVTIDADSMDRFINKQNHREIGNRLITLNFSGDKVNEIFDRIAGKKAIIKKRTLSVIAQYVEDMQFGDHIIDILEESGVPDSLMDYSLGERNAILNILIYFASSNDPKNHAVLFDIIEKISSPRTCGDKKSQETQDEFSSYLRFDGYEFVDGKIIEVTHALLKSIKSNQERKAQNDTLAEIKYIIVVTKTQRTNRLIVVNNDYDEAIIIADSTSKNIKALLEAIEDGTDVLKCDDLVQCRDYLNSNANCKLYRGKNGKKQIHKLTEIVRFDDSYNHDRKLEISKKVITKKITNLAYKRNLSKQKNKLGT